MLDLLEMEMLTPFGSRAKMNHESNRLTVNRLICGDNVEELARLPKESFDLVYADPPFFSNRHYEIIWGDEAEVRSFEDRWKGGIENYIGWMKPRLQEIWDVLKPTGAFYLHCDWHANAHLRILLDGIFGQENFRNEIIWKRKSGRGETNRKAARFGVVTDYILYYAKSVVTPFYALLKPSRPEYITKFYRYVEPETGRRYRIDDLASPSFRTHLKCEYRGYKPPDNGWAISREKMEQWDKDGRLSFPKDMTGRIQRKRYLDELKGEVIQNLWDDIPPVGPAAQERQGYPTQKPRDLLKRIIETSSVRGDWVLDPFCGCGTTALAAQELDRNWVGIDISPTAIKTVEKQLVAMKLRKDVDYTLAGLPATRDELRNLKPFEFQNWVIDEMRGWHSRKKTGDMGLDGEIRRDLSRVAAGIQVKQSDDVDRTVLDKFETALRRAGHNKGYIVAFSFGKGAYEEAARLRNSGELNVILLPVEKLLDKDFSLADFDKGERL